MRFHHVCLIVTDMDRALRLWRDTLGFTPYIDAVIPGDESLFAQATLDQIFGVEQASSRMVMLTSAGGSKIELQECGTPRTQGVPRDQLSYGFAGITEVAFAVDGIDGWFEKVRSAGYETQTDHVWSVGGGRLRSFLFHDDDGSLIQLVEEPESA
jgi:catechol 2,3-dioxygenase-like lactoylglutathione lyase family enzyme